MNLGSFDGGGRRGGVHSVAGTVVLSTIVDSGIHRGSRSIPDIVVVVVARAVG